MTANLHFILVILLTCMSSKTVGLTIRVRRITAGSLPIGAQPSAAKGGSRDLDQVVKKEQDRKQIIAQEARSPPPRRSRRASVAPPRTRVESLGRTYVDDYLGRHVRRRLAVLGVQ